MLARKLRRTVGLGPNPSYWISLFGDSQTNRLYGLAEASNNTIYAVGDARVNSLTSHSLSAVDADGTFLFSKHLVNTGNPTVANKVTVDDSGDVYSVGLTYASGESYSDGILVKHNGAGNLIAQYELEMVNSVALNDCQVDNSGSIYVVGSYPTGAASFNAYLAKLTSTFAKTWEVRVNASVNCLAFAKDNDHIYVVGVNGYIAKFTTAGVAVWQRTLGATQYRGIDVDAAGNVFVVSFQGNVAKYDPAGSLVWQRSLTSFNIRSIKIASDGGIFLCGQTSNASHLWHGESKATAIVMRLNSSGSTAWQNGLSSTLSADRNSSDFDCKLVIGSRGNLIVGGMVYRNSSGYGLQDSMVCSLPPDGSLTGTYGDIQYDTTTIPNVAGELTNTDRSYSVLSASIPYNSGVLTEGTNAYSSTVIEL